MYFFNSSFYLQLRLLTSVEDKILVENDAWNNRPRVFQIFFLFVGFRILINIPFKRVMCVKQKYFQSLFDGLWREMSNVFLITTSLTNLDLNLLHLRNPYSNNILLVTAKQWPRFFGWIIVEIKSAFPSLKKCLLTIIQTYFLQRTNCW